MSATGQLIRSTRHVIAYFGLNDPDCPHFADPATGTLDLVAGVYRTHTGKIPTCFTTDPERARQVIEVNQPVMDALHVISQALPTDAPSDQPDGPDDVIEHITGWLAQIDPFTGRHPGLSDVIGVLERAAALAEATVPRQRNAA
ncbi:hypothetical protein [Streptomyces hydrogenans]|uniref:hypothetical protein n=1 Tax=Streptomyces hydrogenans TaxID=1873719 RepID=UPI0036E26335